MMKKSILGYGLGAILVLALAAPAWAANAGKFTALQGQVTIKKVNGQSVQAALGTAVYQGDLVKTSRSGKATILFNDGSVLRLGPSTDLRIDKLVYEEEKGVAEAAYDIAKGSVMCVVGALFGNDDSDFKVTTPTSVSGVRGTMFMVWVDETGITRVVCFENQVEVASVYDPDEYVVLDESMASDIASGQLPGQPILMTAEELAALQKTLAENNPSQNNNQGRKNMIQGTNFQSLSGTNQFNVVFTTAGGIQGEGGTDTNLGDNPSNLIYQEPPIVTELTITVGIP